jgi:hypothetical protein
MEATYTSKTTFDFQRVSLRWAPDDMFETAVLFLPVMEAFKIVCKFLVNEIGHKNALPFTIHMNMTRA